MNKSQLNILHHMVDSKLKSVTDIVNQVVAETRSELKALSSKFDTGMKYFNHLKCSRSSYGWGLCNVLPQ